MIFKTAALELQSVDKKEVVKVAGLVRRLKNWFKRRSDSDYKNTVETLHNDAAKIQGTLTALYNEINKLQISIKDGELAEYNTALNNVKELSARLWSEVKQTSNDSKDYYTLQDMEVPGFDEWFKKFLPKGYDLDLGTIYNKPMKEVKWYSNLVPQQISLREGDGALKYLLAEVKKTLVRDSFATPEEVDRYLSNRAAFIKAFQDAVVNGVLITANVKKPSDKVPKHMGGSTEIQVTTAPFAIPGSSIMIQAKVDLIDLSTTKSSRGKLSLKKTHYVTALGNAKAQSRLDQLTKLAFAQEAPIKTTQLSDTQFAQVMREGYKKAFGTEPTAETLASGWAQAVLESGRPIKLLNNNVGNIKATDNWVKSGKTYYTKSTGEFNGEGKSYEHSDAKWRSYPTPEDGAAGYWNLLGGKHKNAMSWMAAGDPKSASVTLAMGGYFTANIPKYADGMNGLYHEFITKIAPSIPDLRSAPMAAPGPKPPIKNWRDDYSKAEREEILGKTVPSNTQVPAAGNNEVDLTDIDQLTNTLYADDSGPMEKLVKQAILKECLPTSKNLIVITSSHASFYEKTEYARVTGYILNRFIDATTSVHTDGDRVELQCSILGSALVTTGATQALCDCVSDALLLKKNIKIEAMVVPGFISKHSQMDINTLYRNNRMFHLKSLEK